MFGTIAYSLALAANVATSACADTVNPRTPQNIVAHYSKLDIPKEAQVLEYQDTFVSKDSGEIHEQGFLTVTLQFDSTAMAQYVQAGESQGFKPLVESDTNFTFIKRQLSGVVPQGLYKMDRGVRSNYWLVVLNRERNTISVRYDRISSHW